MTAVMKQRSVDDDPSVTLTLEQYLAGAAGAVVEEPDPEPPLVLETPRREPATFEWLLALAREEPTVAWAIEHLREEELSDVGILACLVGNLDRADVGIRYGTTRPVLGADL